MVDSTGLSILTINPSYLGISLIEWPQRLQSVPIPEDRLDINIRIQSDEKNNSETREGEDQKARIMTLKPSGAAWEERLQSMRSEGYLDDLIV